MQDLLSAKSKIGLSFLVLFLCADTALAWLGEPARPLILTREQHLAFDAAAREYAITLGEADYELASYNPPTYYGFTIQFPQESRVPYERFYKRAFCRSNKSRLEWSCTERPSLRYLVIEGHDIRVGEEVTRMEVMQVKAALERLTVGDLDRLGLSFDDLELLFDDSMLTRVYFEDGELQARVTRGAGAGWVLRLHKIPCGVDDCELYIESLGYWIH